MDCRDDRNAKTACDQTDDRLDLNPFLRHPRHDPGLQTKLSHRRVERAGPRRRAAGRRGHAGASAE